MNTITANELKTKGVSALEKALVDGEEAIISVRGRPQYVVVGIEHYDRLREAEIYAAWQDARESVAAGEFSSETAESHIDRLKTELSADDV